MIAPSEPAEDHVRVDDALTSIIPPPIVFATAVPTGERGERS